jgi:hypothetical protein
MLFGFLEIWAPFMMELKENDIPGMFATTEFRIFCLPACYLQIKLGL